MAGNNWPKAEVKKEAINIWETPAHTLQSNRTHTRGDRAEARSKLGPEALHDLGQLGEHAVEGGADGALPNVVNRGQRNY